MNPLEERLNQLEMRVTRYRNFSILLCLLLVAVVSIAATDGISPFQAKLAPGPISMPKGNVGVPDLPKEDIPAVIPDGHRAGKVAAQTQGVIRTRGLQIVNSDGQAVVELWPSTSGNGFISVNSAGGKRLVYVGYGAENGDGLIAINSTEAKRLIGLGSGIATGDGGIWVRNKNEELLIGLNADETPGIHINKTGSENLMYLGANFAGNGYLNLNNKSGKGLVSMVADETAGNLWLSNNNDKTIAYLGWEGEGRGVLRLKSETGTELITAGSNTEDDGLFRVSNRYGTLGFAVVGTEEHGYAAILDAQDRFLAEMTATTGGNGLIRTLSQQGITTWSSNSAQVNTGSSLRGDMDNDGDIDGDDFLIFSENFGKKR